MKQVSKQLLQHSISRTDFPYYAVYEFQMHHLKKLIYYYITLKKCGGVYFHGIG